METVLITGGTGMIGTAVSNALLKKGYKVIILTRGHEKRKDEKSGIIYAEWDPSKSYVDPSALRAADHIIHLAGANIAGKRWTKKRKAEIVSSRVKGSALIVDHLQKIPNKIRTVVSASAIGWYGPDPVVPNPNPFRESEKPGEDFLASTCNKWEGSISPVINLGKRLVIFRTGIVLSNKGGALAKFRKALKFRVAPILGSGSQVISWIHIDDLVNMYIAALLNEKMTGVYNAVAWSPVSNRQFVQELAKSEGHFYIPVRVPAFFLKMILGEVATEVLKSCTVSNDRIEATGFSFQYSFIHQALGALHKKTR